MDLFKLIYLAFTKSLLSSFTRALEIFLSSSFIDKQSMSEHEKMTPIEGIKLIMLQKPLSDIESEIDDHLVVMNKFKAQKNPNKTCD